MIKNATIITVNSKNEVISDGGIVIEGNQIIDIGIMQQLKTNLTVKSFQTYLKISQKLKGG